MLTKMVDGVQVVMSAEEEAEIRAEWAAAEAAKPAEAIKAQIKALEASITERRYREAILTDEGKAWLEGVEEQIQTLRNQL